MIITWIFLFIFLVWAYLMKKGKFKNLDDLIYNRLKFTDGKTSLYRFVTMFGSTFFLTFSTSLFLVLFPIKKIGLSLAIIMLGDAAVVSIMKHIFKRDRPNKKRLVNEKGYSFPSGHTFSATCFYGFLLIIFCHDMELIPQLFIFGSYLVFIILIAKSRIYLGVHYFSDVVAGFLLSSGYLFFTVYLVSDILNLL